LSLWNATSWRVNSEPLTFSSDLDT